MKFRLLLLLAILFMLPGCQKDSIDPENDGEEEIAEPFRNIPVVKIVTEGNKTIDSKETYIKATIEIEDPEHLYWDVTTTGPLTTEIRGRGNSTWTMSDKKPYKIKLNQKRALLGMSTDKEWALLANYADKSLMRNYIAFEIARLCNIAWVPQGRPVELYLNGSYRGLYTITEHVKVSDERVNVAIVGTPDISGSAVTGGYFFEVDERHDGDTWFDTGKGLPIVFKEPKVPEAAQLAYVKKYFSDLESALYGVNFKDPAQGYAKYIDVPSFAANYIVHELTKNVDGNMRLSTFFTKARDGKLMVSNVWDFDLTLGNCNYMGASGNGPTGFYVKNVDTRYYNRLFLDTAFHAEVKRQWNVLYPHMPEIVKKIEAYAVQLDPAQKRNFQKWQILNIYVWPNVVWPGTYQGEVDYLKDFLTRRAAWMNTEINKM